MGIRHHKDEESADPANHRQQKLLDHSVPAQWNEHIRDRNPEKTRKHGPFWGITGSTPPKTAEQLIVTGSDRAGGVAAEADTGEKSDEYFGGCQPAGTSGDAF
jgi:hypothetical protein